MAGVSIRITSGLGTTLSFENIMHKTGPFTNSGVSKFVKLVAVYTKHQQLNNTIESIGIVNINIEIEFSGRGLTERDAGAGVAPLVGKVATRRPRTAARAVASRRAPHAAGRGRR